MEDLRQMFRERTSEIDSYLDLLAAFEAQVQEGLPRLGAKGPVISTTQQKILYSSVYLQLYNLIEATITKCIESVSTAVTLDSKWGPRDLSDSLLREWVRFAAQTHSDLSYDNRLASSLSLCKLILGDAPIEEIRIDRGGGGNWDDEQIYKVATRLGCELAITNESNQGVKQPFKNELGALALIVKSRNDLAHGSLSFVQCGEEITVSELRELKVRTTKYLEEVLNSFAVFVKGGQFLTPDRRAEFADGLAG